MLQFLRRVYAITALTLCASAWLIAQAHSSRPCLSSAFDDYASSPSLDSIATSPQYALSGKLAPTLLPALPPSESTAPSKGAHYIIEGTLSSNPSLEHDSSYPTSFLVNQASISDAAIIGTVDSELPSRPTANNAFLYTPLRVYVEEVLFDKNKGVAQGSTITLVRPGGRMVINGVPIVAADAGFAWQHVGDKYIFFLHRLVGTRQYRIYPGGSFRLTTNATVTADALNSSPTMQSLGYQNSFLTEISAAYKLSQEQPAEIPGGLNWSMQHWLAVYSPEFQSPRFFAGVD